MVELPPPGADGLGVHHAENVALGSAAGCAPDAAIWGTAKNAEACSTSEKASCL